jgi:glycosyltransferase involved in cell wall biosynthesis
MISVMSKISVVFIVKNAIKQGYCFWESLQSCLPFANELIISEGFSDDDTLSYLIKFKQRYHKLLPIHIYQDKWDDESYHGEVIANISNRAIQKARHGWIYYLQADEVIHEDSVAHIKHIATLPQFNSVSFPFYHFIQSWSPATDPKYYQEAIRMIRRGRNINLMGDGWNFEGEIDPICPAGHDPKPIYHFAWVFPKQNDTKDIEHAKIYKNIPEYQQKMQRACERLNEEKKPYPLTDFDDFPKLARRFVGNVKYTLPGGI